MLTETLLQQIKEYDEKFINSNDKDFDLPIYDPETHYIELTKSSYFHALLIMRHFIKVTSDYYFGVKQGAINVDLFMLTPSVSSPMGPGSDSEAVPIQFGKYGSHLVDSSQFGFEPLLMNGFDKVYCYLPSMRGEDPDKRHLNQFFHCEAEIKGELKTLVPIIEGYLKTLSTMILHMPNILKLLSKNYEKTVTFLSAMAESSKFPEIEFDDAVQLLVKNGYEHTVNFTEHGRDITSDGELVLTKLLKYDVPFWIRNYDRDRTVFYQKPNPENPATVINADLIFSPIIEGAFGGEIVGCGQRQDNPDELLESLKRQGISSEHYEWYINLRKLPYYHTTSGFGIGIERFITWSLGRDDIKDAIIYPRLKNVMTYP